MVCGLLWGGTQRAHSAEPSVLVLGDSLSAAHNLAVEQGWVALLESQLQSQRPGAVVVNASISGETSAGGAERIERLLDAHAPTWLLLELGANDALRGLPLSQTQAHLHHILLHARQRGIAVFLIGIEVPVNYGRRYRDALRALYAELGATADAFMPHLLAPLGLERTHFQEDGLHPTATAQPLILQALLAAWQQADSPPAPLRWPAP